MNENYIISIVKKYAQEARIFILDLILPINCLGCGKEGSWLCKKCHLAMKNNKDKICFSCGKKNTKGSLCSLCSPIFYFDDLYIAGNYQDYLLSQLIKIYKYRFAQDISLILADFIYKNLSARQQENNKFNNLPEFNGALNFKKWLFIPVPLHKKRLRWRGFNQAELLAKELTKKLSGNLESKKLKRIKFHLPQTRLKKAARKNNIKDSFIWKGKNLNNHPIVLVDDIITTGATMNECARILKQNGAGKIICLTVAHGL